MSLPELTPEQEIEYAIQLGYPLQPPPENVVPDYENGDTIAYQLYITAGVCFTLMIIFTVFRILNVSVFKRKTYLLDEGTISTCLPERRLCVRRKTWADRNTARAAIFILGFVRLPRVPSCRACANPRHSCYVWPLSP
jgi:hypothetical protein